MSVKAAKVTKVNTEKPTATVVTNLLNSYFANYQSELTSSEQQLKFKTLTTKLEQQFKEADAKAKAKDSKPPARAIIDINDFEPVRTFGKKCAQKQKADPTKKLPKEVLSELIADTFDGRLRGLLEIAKVAVIKPPKPEGEPKKSSKKDPNAEPTPRAKPLPKENAFEKFVIPSLKLGTQRTHSIEDHIAAINSFFTNKQKLQTRAFNLTFPHSKRNPTKPAEGVNVVYLQHVCKYHDDILEQLVAGVTDREILIDIQNKFADGFVPEKCTDDERESILLQLRNSEVITELLKQPESGKQSYKWLDSLHAVKPGKNKGLIQTQNPLSKSEKLAVSQLVRELNAVRAFVNLFNKAKDANPDRDLNDCYDEYKMMLAEIAEFYTEHKPKSRNNTTFMKYLIESTQFIAKKFGYKQTKLNKDKDEVWNSPLKSFVTDLHSKLNFKFDRETKKAIDSVLRGEVELNDESLQDIVEKFQNSLIEINAPKLYDVNKLDIYSKLGKFVPAGLSKPYKVAVGLAIMQWILDQIRLQRALNAKKKELIVYVRA